MAPTPDPKKPPRGHGRSRPPRFGLPGVVLASLAILSLALLASACGGNNAPGVASVGSNTPSPSASTPGAASASSGPLAFAQCMRTHGVPRFPDPDSQGSFPPFNAGVSKQTSLAAQSACKHLLSHGGSAGTPQQRQEKLTVALHFAQCMRKHGFPTFPDPASQPGGSTGFDVGGTGIDPSSPQFKATQQTCENQVVPRSSSSDGSK
jgi:hypothetical protein